MSILVRDKYNANNVLLVAIGGNYINFLNKIFIANKSRTKYL